MQTGSRGGRNKTESLCKRAGRGGRNKTESLCERAGRGRKQPKKNAGNRRYRETIRSVFGFSRGGEDFIAFLFQGGLAEVGFFGKIFAEFGTDVFDFFFKGAEFVFQKQFIDVFAQVIDERGAFFEHIKFPERVQRGAFGRCASCCCSSSAAGGVSASRYKSAMAAKRFFKPAFLMSEERTCSSYSSISSG